MSDIKQALVNWFDIIVHHKGDMNEAKLRATLDPSLRISWDGVTYEHEAYINFCKGHNAFVNSVDYEIKDTAVSGDKIWAHYTVGGELKDRRKAEFEWLGIFQFVDGKLKWGLGNGRQLKGDKLDVQDLSK